MPVPVSSWLVAAIVALTPIVVMIIDWAFAQFGQDIPSWLKPILATALGALATWLAGVTFANPVYLALAGMATIGLREILDQLGQALGYVKK